jgi:ParB-like chromosome segregation protein Spo0J
VADLFPMLADDELAELAEDIKQRGLLQPVVLDPQGRVLDGRNRLAACRLAGVEPTFETYNGDDPDGYALAANGQRREQTKAQKALIAARALTELKIDKRQAEVARALRVTDALVSQAILIENYARDLADQIMVTGTGLAEARETAAKRRHAAEAARAQMDRLRDNAPDLLTLLEEERMSLADAIDTLNGREERARQEAEEAQRQAEAEATEAERQLLLKQHEHDEWAERHRDRIRSVNTGWPTMREIILAEPDSDRAREIIDGLGRPDREALDAILAEITGAMQ